MILTIDNYDSFTYNLVQALRSLGREVKVVKNDEIDVAGIAAHGARGRSSMRPRRSRSSTSLTR